METSLSWRNLVYQIDYSSPASSIVQIYILHDWQSDTFICLGFSLQAPDCTLHEGRDCCLFYSLCVPSTLYSAGQCAMQVFILVILFNPKCLSLVNKKPSITQQVNDRARISSEIFLTQKIIYIVLWNDPEKK